jgi:hypothetical protein
VTLTKTATGFIVQDNVMTYATPGIEQRAVPIRYWDDAAHAGGIDWEPTTRRVFDVLTGQHLPGVHGVWNEKTFLGIATDKHQLIAHASLGAVVETIQDLHGGAPIDAVVCLDGGRRVGARVTHEVSTIPGDPSPIARETWAWLRHDAKGSLVVIENAQRMFCTNQLGMLSSAATHLRVRHVGNVGEKVDELIHKLKERQDDWRLWEQEMAVLQATPVRPSQFERFIRLYIPEPVPPVSNVRALSAQQQLAVLGDQYFAELGKNAYAGFQAIVEFEDKARASRGAVSRFQRAIQPNPNKDRGLRMLVEVAR